MTKNILAEANIAITLFPPVKAVGNSKLSAIKLPLALACGL